MTLYASRTQKRNVGLLPLILNLGIGGGWSASDAGRLIPGHTAS